MRAGGITEWFEKNVEKQYLKNVDGVNADPYRICHDEWINWSSNMEKYTTNYLNGHIN